MNGIGSWAAAIATAKAAPPELLEGVIEIVDRAFAENMTFAEFMVEMQALFNRLAIPVQLPGKAPATAVIDEDAE
jgi:hypothetical protein